MKYAQFSFHSSPICQLSLRISKEDFASERLLLRRFVLLNANTGAITELFKPGGLCITPLGPGGDVLVSKGNVGITVGQDGRVSRRAGLTWSDQPVAVSYSHPYAIALLPNYVEIRLVHRVSNNGLAQVRVIHYLSTDA